jgi:hypothetical protein
VQFIKNFLLNLVILVVFGLAIYLISPSTIMSPVFSLYWWLFGPIAIGLLVFFALPRKRRKS